MLKLLLLYLYTWTKNSGSRDLREGPEDWGGEGGGGLGGGLGGGFEGGGFDSVGGGLSAEKGKRLRDGSWVSMKFWTGGSLKKPPNLRIIGSGSGSGSGSGIEKGSGKGCL